MNLITILKSCCPLSVLFTIKYLSQLCGQKEIETTKDAKRIFYLDAPDYANIGDQAIALAIREFAEKNFPDYKFIEILQNDVAKYLNSLKKRIHSDDIIFLTGGGNMGNIYKMFEATRRMIIKSFPNNRIVIFPQTIDYTNNIFGSFSSAFSKKIYSAHKNLVLCAREKFSYKKMKTLYPDAKVILCPDIVLSLDTNCAAESSQYISLCLRNDCERALTDKDRKEIQLELEKELLPIREVSTISNVETITHKNRESIVNEKLKELSLSKFVVTDRLHAMIFCFLTNTPCIVFGNSNHKIEGVYDFLSNVSFVQYIKNLDDLSDAVRTLKLLPCRGHKSVDFSELIHIIKEV